MKFIVTAPVQIDVKFIEIHIPVRFGTQDIPVDFPLRKNAEWKAIVDIETGQIQGWPQQPERLRLFTKVCGEGVYQLLDIDGLKLAKIDYDYVPNGCVPGEFGDYIDLSISPTGIITNWPKKPDISAFFPTEE